MSAITSIAYIILAATIFIIIKYNNWFKALVLVKVTNPTKTQIQRYIEWKKTMNRAYKFEILSDRNLTIPNMTVKVISPIELFSKWPNMLKKRGRCKYKGNSHEMWVSIVEHYVLCAKRTKSRFKYLWMVEQDLGYSGNLYEFMKQYDNNNEDVIFQGFGKHSLAFWPGCYTPEYHNWIIKYHKNYTYQSYNWITRLSKRAIDLLLPRI